MLQTEYLKSFISARESLRPTNRHQKPCISAIIYATALNISLSLILFLFTHAVAQQLVTQTSTITVCLQYAPNSKYYHRPTRPILDAQLTPTSAHLSRTRRLRSRRGLQPPPPCQAHRPIHSKRDHIRYRQQLRHSLPRVLGVHPSPLSHVRHRPAVHQPTMRHSSRQMPCRMRTAENDSSHATQPRATREFANLPACASSPPFIS